MRRMNNKTRCCVRFVKKKNVIFHKAQDIIFAAGYVEGGLLIIVKAISLHTAYTTISQNQAWNTAHLLNFVPIHKLFDLDIRMYTVPFPILLWYD